MSPATVAAALAVVRRRRGIDFRDYRPELVERAIGAHLAGETAAAWLARLEHDDALLGALVTSLRVAVTSFFRDPEVFSLVQEKLLPGLMHRVSLATTIRGWAIGVGTGEEAWSLAMVLDSVVSPVEWELLATDIDADALRVAAARRYPAPALPAGSTLGHYLEPLPAGEVRVAASLAERVSFVRHQFMGPELAPPQAVVPLFHVISCRNVVLHFDRRLQAQAWARLASMLHPAGMLLAGPSEAPSAESGLHPWPGIAPGSGLFRVAR